MINLSDFEVKGSKIKMISLNQIKIFCRIGETCFLRKFQVTAVYVILMPLPIITFYSEDVRR